MKPADADILFVSYGGGHVTSLEPVYVKMLRYGFKCAYLALTTAQSYLASRRLPFFGYADLPGADAPETIAAAHRLLGEREIPGPVSWRETLAYHGLNFL